MKSIAKGNSRLCAITVAVIVLHVLSWTCDVAHSQCGDSVEDVQNITVATVSRTSINVSFDLPLDAWRGGKAPAFLMLHVSEWAGKHILERKIDPDPFLQAKTKVISILVEGIEETYVHKELVLQVVPHAIDPEEVDNELQGCAIDKKFHMTVDGIWSDWSVVKQCDQMAVCNASRHAGLNATQRSNLAQWRVEERECKLPFDGATPCNGSHSNTTLCPSVVACPDDNNGIGAGEMDPSERTPGMANYPAFGIVLACILPAATILLFFFNWYYKKFSVPAPSYQIQTVARDNFSMTLDPESVTMLDYPLFLSRQTGIADSTAQLSTTVYICYAHDLANCNPDEQQQRRAVKLAGLLERLGLTPILPAHEINEIMTDVNAWFQRRVMTVDAVVVICSPELVKQWRCVERDALEDASLQLAYCENKFVKDNMVTNNIPVMPVYLSGKDARDGALPRTLQSNKFAPLGWHDADGRTTFLKHMRNLRKQRDTLGHMCTPLSDTELSVSLPGSHDSLAQVHPPHQRADIPPPATVDSTLGGTAGPAAEHRHLPSDYIVDQHRIMLGMASAAGSRDEVADFASKDHTDFVHPPSPPLSQQRHFEVHHSPALPPTAAPAHSQSGSLAYNVPYPQISEQASLRAEGQGDVCMRPPCPASASSQYRYTNYEPGECVSLPGMTLPGGEVHHVGAAESELATEWSLTQDAQDELPYPELDAMLAQEDFLCAVLGSEYHPTDHATSNESQELSEDSDESPPQDGSTSSNGVDAGSKEGPTAMTGPVVELRYQLPCDTFQTLRLPRQVSTDTGYTSALVTPTGGLGSDMTTEASLHHQYPPSMPSAGATECTAVDPEPLPGYGQQAQDGSSSGSTGDGTSVSSVTIQVARLDERSEAEHLPQSAFTSWVTTNLKQ